MKIIMSDYLVSAEKIIVGRVWGEKEGKRNGNSFAVTITFIFIFSPYPPIDRENQQILLSIC